MNFGENVKRLREAHSYTQAELASMAGVSQSVLSQYETSAKSPNVFVAVKLARLLGTTVDELVNGKQEGRCS